MHIPPEVIAKIDRGTPLYNKLCAARETDRVGPVVVFIKKSDDEAPDSIADRQHNLAMRLEHIDGLRVKSDDICIALGALYIRGPAASIVEALSFDAVNLAAEAAR
jgi:hypothetical protein